MSGRTHWMCIRGHLVPLAQKHCHEDECEEHRRYIEDEEALPVPALAGPKESTDR